MEWVIVFRDGQEAVSISVERGSGGYYHPDYNLRVKPQKIRRRKTFEILRFKGRTIVGQSLTWLPTISVTNCRDTDSATDCEAKGRNIDVMDVLARQYNFTYR